jgi:hypothetical protein
MNNFNLSGLRIAAAIVASSVSFLAAPAVMASSELDAVEDADKSSQIEHVSHAYLGEIDASHAAYIDAMETKLGLWE